MKKPDPVIKLRITAEYLDLADRNLSNLVVILEQSQDPGFAFDRTMNESFVNADPADRLTARQLDIIADRLATYWRVSVAAGPALIKMEVLP